MLNEICSKIRGCGSQWRYAEKLWDGIGRGRPVVIVPCDITTNHDPATGIGELRVAALAPLCCSAIGVDDIRIVYPHEVFRPTDPIDMGILQEEFGDADVILLGSEITNRISSVALELLGKDEPWLKTSCGKSDGAHWIAYQDGIKKFTKYQNEVDIHPHSMVEDFGLFVVRRNCFSKDKNTDARVILFYGAHTHGTQASADLFFSILGASEVSKRHRVNHPSSWNRSVDGMVRITPYADSDSLSQQNSMPVPMRLTRRNRQIEVIAPSYLKGIVIENPVMAGLISNVTSFTRFGVTRYLLLRVWGYFGILGVALGAWLNSPPLMVASVLFYFIQRMVKEKNW
ncbi:MAG: hypothetical protein FD161_941 [Limisphaerales bacterium]|nr:MAG: hypothetical protein FD161_941 [Limisphaerales bacterium]KAG0509923.1 MAG: hypothetical protein E1N63_941 [Limisphaerales bacterium]TXT50606.1 MAG: hypothetical protein FD140_2238 [Limisphaerales bacterium]